jgi:hypothetical protein
MEVVLVLSCWRRRVAALGLAVVALLLVAADEAGQVVPPELDALLQKAQAWDKLPPEVRAQLVEQFRSYLPEIRRQVEDALYAQLKAKRAAAWEPINRLILGLTCAGPLLLLLPVFVARRYPGKLGTLFRYSALSAVLFSVTVLLFSIPLLIFSEVWEEIVIVSDPRLRSVDAAFDLMDQNAAEFLSRDLPLKPTLEQAASGEAQSFATVLLDNLIEVRRQAEVFEPLVDIYRKLDWVFGSLPKLQCLLFAVLFALPLYPIFREIVLLPVRAAAGGVGEGRRVVKLALRNWWQEILAIFCMVVLFLVILVTSDIVLTLIAEPATETMLTFLFVSLDYLGHEAKPALVPLYFSLLAAALFYLFNMVTMTVGLMFYLKAAHRVFRARFHQQVPLRRQGRFWVWGTLSVLWVQAMPLLFIFLALPAIHGVFWAYEDADPPNYLGGLVAAGALLFFGIVLVFWLARGFKALTFLWRYRALPAAPVGVANPVANG